MDKLKNEKFHPVIAMWSPTKCEIYNAVHNNNKTLMWKDIQPSVNLVHQHCLAQKLLFTTNQQNIESCTR